VPILVHPTVTHCDVEISLSLIKLQGMMWVDSGAPHCQQLRCRDFIISNVTMQHLLLKMGLFSGGAIGVIRQHPGAHSSQSHSRAGSAIIPLISFTIISTPSVNIGLSKMHTYISVTGTMACNSAHKHMSKWCTCHSFA
jgi:hypothetical protein